MFACTVFTLVVSARGPLFTQRPTVHTFTHMLPNARMSSLYCTPQPNHQAKLSVEYNAQPTVECGPACTQTHTHTHTDKPGSVLMENLKRQIKKSRKLLQTHFLCCAVVFFPVQSRSPLRHMTCAHITSQPCKPIGPEPGLLTLTLSVYTLISCLLIWRTDNCKKHSLTGTQGRPY